MIKESTKKLLSTNAYATIMSDITYSKCVFTNGLFCLLWGTRLSDYTYVRCKCLGAERNKCQCSCNDAPMDKIAYFTIAVQLSEFSGLTSTRESHCISVYQTFRKRVQRQLDSHWVLLKRFIDITSTRESYCIFSIPNVQKRVQRQLKSHWVAT